MGEGQMSQAEMAMRDAVRAAAQAGKDKVFGAGSYPGVEAAYVLEVIAAKVFQGYKSETQAVIEFKVLESRKMKPDDWYRDLEKQPKHEKSTVWPQQPGSTVSLTADLKVPAQCGRFLGALSAITRDTVLALTDESKDGKGQPILGLDGKPKLQFMELIQFCVKGQPEPPPSLLVGARVRLETVKVDRPPKLWYCKEKFTSVREGDEWFNQQS